jgi:hypothetical protein
MTFYIRGVRWDGVRWGGVKLSPLGTPATSGPIVPAPDYVSMEQYGQ